MSLRMSHHVSILSYHQPPLQHGLTQTNVSGPSLVLVPVLWGFSVTMPRSETLFTCTLFCRATVSCTESLSKPVSGTKRRLATQGKSLMSDGFWRWTDRKKKMSGILLRLSQNTKLNFFDYWISHYTTFWSIQVLVLIVISLLFDSVFSLILIHLTF